MARKSKKKGHVSGQLLGTGVALLGMGFLLLLVAALLPDRSPILQAFRSGLQLPVPYVLFIGALVSFIGWISRPRKQTAGEPPRAARAEPEWFPDDSTDFVRNPSSLMQSPLVAGRRAPATAWSMQVFDDIEWRRFETLCSELFAQAGFEARTQSHGADGGVDIWLYSRHAKGPVAVVQCKHWQGKQVGVKEMREFFGVMAARKVARGTYATTSTFTDDAVRFARENGIHLLDGEGLLALIGKRTPEQQQALLEHAYEGEYWRPTCASCGTRMVERTARKARSSFWGCADYPRCRSTLPMRSS
jgi:restriction system protein